MQQWVPAAVDGRDRQPVSYGPCQFPTLGFVVDRYKRNRDFVSEPFWKLRLLHGKDGLVGRGTVLFWRVLLTVSPVSRLGGSCLSQLQVAVWCAD